MMFKLLKKKNHPEALMPVGGHLSELRSRIIKSLVVVGLFFGIAMQKADWLLNLLRRLLPADLFFNSPAEALWVTLKVAFFAGFFVSFPYILFQVWRFISPGLAQREKKLAIPFIIGGSLFFILGVLFCYFAVLPFALTYLIQFGIEKGIKPQIMITGYIDFVLKLMLAFGVIFILPVALVLLGRAGIVSSAWLAKNRKYALLINSIVSAILTPTPDVFNMMIMMVPLMILYEAGIWGIRLFGEVHSKTIKGSGNSSTV
jgi:sec-independent protein translocase protein TatC